MSESRPEHPPRRSRRPAAALLVVALATVAGLTLTGMRPAATVDAADTGADTRLLAAPRATTSTIPRPELAVEGEVGTDLAIGAAALLATGTAAGLSSIDANTPTDLGLADETGLAVGLAAGFSVDVKTDPELPTPAAAPTAPYFDEPLVDIGRITIPAIGIDRTLHQGISLHNIDRGPSHWPGTAAPGEIGNVVIAGHRTTHGAPFRNIDLLETGDEVVLTAAGVRYTYVVVGDEVVTPDGLHIVEQTPQPTATLFACHPPGSAAYRFVVHLALDSSESSIPAMMR